MFVDAASIARTMGLEFLLVDSLCIIQDSRDNWTKRSGFMGSIYHNSSITIAVTASTDSNGGIFMDRKLSNICSLQQQIGVGAADARFGW